MSLGSNGPIGWTDRALAPGPGVILGRKGAYRGVEYSPEPFFVIDTAYFVVPRTDLDMRWLYYAAKHYKLGEVDDGSPIPSTTRSAVYILDLQVPPVPEQQAIAHILGTLDDKIELNRGMNETLEAMARALFKSWFVDFEPVRAKLARRGGAERRAPGLPKPIADLFPDSFEDSELGEIPKGWKVGVLEDCCERVQNGGTPRRDQPLFWAGGDMPWLTSGEVRQSIVTGTENFITAEGLVRSSAKMLPAMTTVVALYGATAGQVCLIAEEMCTNQACTGLVPKRDYAAYTYLHASSHVEQLGNQARGSAQQNLSQQIVCRYPTLLPSNPVLQLFEGIAESLFERWILGLNESRSLAAIRDALLPKLISGELRVEDTERIVGRHG